ncbi:hypothetical protein [Polycyclovorans algicola]|uniref:hypothetical protein n=1 Tax=Polycyclovorans algicola TaxID=616992 RepID=UPI0004A7760B|nr:hypothetical protein [Polycyclovorans algicola]
MLPLPFERYAWGAAFALIVSFVLAALFLRAPASRAAAGPAAYRWALPGWLVWGLRAVTLALLVLAIASGVFGAANPYANFNMTLFWVVFMLGFAYATVLVGDLFALINPWRTLAEGLARLWPRLRDGVVHYPERLGVWPAALLWVALVWFELFGHVEPRSLAAALLAYTALTLVASAVFGVERWFRHGELFSVWLNLLARLAPVAFAHEAGGPPTRSFSLRWPFSGVLHMDEGPRGRVMLIMALLATTAFDGLHETEIWHGVYWLWLYPEWLSGWLGTNPLEAFPALRRGYGWWNAAWLWALPLLYLAAYALASFATARLAPALGGTAAVMRRFAPSLLPIVLVYHASHYYTLLQVQGPKIVPLLSDPFGWNTNWLGTAQWFMRVNAPDVYRIWDVQLALILGGHIVSVALAHRIAIGRLPDRRGAVVSQLPMLVLMVAFTVGGLWILAQPFQSP